MRIDGARKGSPFMPEEFAFEKAGRHGRAMTSLPVPVSPVIKTVVFVPATASTWPRIERRLPRRPTIVSRNEDSARSGLRTVGPSGSRVVFIGALSGYGFGCMTKLDAVLIFCSPF